MLHIMMLYSTVAFCLFVCFFAGSFFFLEKQENDLAVEQNDITERTRGARLHGNGFRASPVTLTAVVLSESTFRNALASSHIAEDQSSPVQSRLDRARRNNTEQV